MKKKFISKEEKKQLFILAKEGDVEAQIDIAERWIHDKNWERNLEESFRWYREAAEQGNLKAILALARVLYKGIGVNKDGVAALKWYKKAARLGSVKAYTQLGYMYEHNKGVETETYDEAIYWYKKAIKEGSVEAKFFLGRLYYNHFDRDKGYDLLLEAAKQGSAGANVEVGEIYSFGGRGCNNKDDSIEYFAEAILAKEYYSEIEDINYYGRAVDALHEYLQNGRY